VTQEAIKGDGDEIMRRVAATFGDWNAAKVKRSEMLSMLDESVEAAEGAYKSAVIDAQGLENMMPRELRLLINAQKELRILQDKAKMEASEEKENLDAAKAAFKTLIEQSVEGPDQMVRKCERVTMAWQEVQEELALLHANRQERKTEIVLAQKNARTALNMLVQLELF